MNVYVCLCVCYLKEVWSKSKNTYCAQFIIEKEDILIQGDNVIGNSYGVNNFNIWHLFHHLGKNNFDR